MNTKKIFKSTVAMIMASLVITAGTAVAATSAVEAGSVTASAISIHEFQIRDFKAYNPYGGQMKTSAPVEFSFDLSEADKGSYNTYMTSYVEVTKDGVQHAMINFKAGDTKCRFNPTEAGTYTAKIYVVDCRGNYGSKTINFYVKNLDDVNISKFEIVPIYGGGMTISNSFKFNYQIDNAQKSNNRYTCAYIEVMKDGVQHGYIDLNCDNPNTKWWTNEHGHFTAKLTVVDYYGHYAVRTIGFDIDGRSSDAHIDYLTLNTPSGKLTAGTPIKFNYGVSNAYTNYDRYTCAQIQVREGGKTAKDGTVVDTIDVNVDKDRNTWKWTPAKAGKYILVFNFTDGYRHYDVKSIAVEVGERLTASATISKTSIDLGQAVTFTGNGVNGAGGYKYQFIYKKVGDNNWTTYKDTSTSNTSTFKPTTAGTYHLQVLIEDANGGHASTWKEVKVLEAMKVTTSVSRTNMDVGQYLTISGSATKGSGNYKYAIYYKKSTDASWKTLKGFSTARSASYAPTSAGTYHFMVQVQDSNGAYASTWKSVTVKSKLVNNSKISATTAKVNKALTVTGAASGGSGNYQYAVAYKLSTASSYTTVRGFSTTKTASVKFSAAGKYTVRVAVKDSNYNTVYKYLTVSVTK